MPTRKSDEQRQQAAAYMRAIRDHKRQRGFCVRSGCWRPATHGLLCWDHVLENRERTRRDRQRLIDQHRCIQCRQPLDEGYTKRRCPDCLQKHRKVLSEDI